MSNLLTIGEVASRSGVASSALRFYEQRGLITREGRLGPPTLPALREGVDLAGRVGALGLAERANDEIAATSARPRRILQTGLDALTASERRVGSSPPRE